MIRAEGLEDISLAKAQRSQRMDGAGPEQVLLGALGVLARGDRGSDSHEAKGSKAQSGDSGQRISLAETLMRGEQRTCRSHLRAAAPSAAHQAMP